MSAWNDPKIVGDPRIADTHAHVRRVAEYLHNNESLHMHQDISDVVCVYCALRASRAFAMYQHVTHDARMGPPDPLPEPERK